MKAWLQIWFEIKGQTLVIWVFIVQTRSQGLAGYLEHF